jgi:hypothetical protein
MHERYHVYFHIFQCVPCNVAHLAGLDIHALQIQIYCCNVDQTADKTKLRVKNYLY